MAVRNITLTPGSDNCLKQFSPTTQLLVGRNSIHPELGRPERVLNDRGSPVSLLHSA